MRLRFAVGFAVLAQGIAGGCAEQTTDGFGNLPDDERNDRFVGAIRDAGYRCETVIDVMAVQGGRMGWRVVCNDALVYLASLDAADAIDVEPVPYGDPRVAPNTLLNQQLQRRELEQQRQRQR
jgi:hypothetical protein